MITDFGHERVEETMRIIVTRRDILNQREKMKINK